LVVEHLVALVQGQRATQRRGHSAEGVDDRVTDRLGRAVSRHPNQDRGSELAFHQRGDRRPLSGADDEVTLLTLLRGVSLRLS
jgi:hypothetical protein